MPPRLSLCIVWLYVSLKAKVITFRDYQIRKNKLYKMLPCEVIQILITLKIQHLDI